MAASSSALILSPRASRQVDGAVVRVRWILALGAWLIITLGNRSFLLSELVVVWLALLVAFNLVIFLLLRRKNLPSSLPLWGLCGDVLFFGSLPFIASTDSAILFLFGLFPTIVAALRYGPYAGAFVALLLTLPYEVLSLAVFLPAPVRDLLRLVPETDVNLVSAGLPVVALFAVVILVGYLAQREREAVAGDTAVELEQLRGAMAGAKLFYQTADALSETLSYSRVLDTMLEAGTLGLPAARREDGPPVGLVLLFETNDPEKYLHVVAWRNLDRKDAKEQIPGKQGIVAEALERGEAVVFTNVATDPELQTFASLRRCRAGVCYPLQAGLNLYGVVVLATSTPRLPSEQHLNLMRAFTNQAAVGFQNARLYQSLREERDHIIDAEANARAKLARDLHDGPTQTLAALAMRLDFITMLLDKEPDKAKEELALSREAVIRTGKEMRELLFTLRPLTLETQGLSPTLQLWAQRLHDVEGVTLDLDAGNFGTEIDPKIGGTVFAVIEEAANNARKHAGGAAIHVRVCQQSDNLVATVQDEGPGFDVEKVEASYDQRGSLGLVNMRERARLLDAHFSIDSAPGRGTRVMLIVPLGGKQA
jgi:signal transduction histidine kinase